jgi:small-conductance mechanosensitive channel
MKTLAFLLLALPALLFVRVWSNEYRALWPYRHLRHFAVGIGMLTAILLLVPLTLLSVTPARSQVFSYSMTAIALVVSLTSASGIYSRFSSRVCIGTGGILLAVLWFFNRVVA